MKTFIPLSMSAALVLAAACSGSNDSQSGTTGLASTQGVSPKSSGAQGDDDEGECHGGAANVAAPKGGAVPACREEDGGDDDVDENDQGEHEDADGGDRGGHDGDDET